MEKKFVSTERKGFHMTFENGLTASVQWGKGNYCDNHFSDEYGFLCNKDVRSNTAEVAVWKGEKWLDANDFVPEEKCGSCDDVVGWLTPEQVVYFLQKVSEYREV